MLDQKRRVSNNVSEKRSRNDIPENPSKTENKELRGMTGMQRDYHLI